MSLPPPVGARSEVEAAFPLTPSQQGMLYHTLLEPAAGVFVEQMVGWLPEALEVERLLAAWRSATSRHPALRTGFRFATVSGGVQEVHRNIALDMVVEDWRNQQAEEQERHFDGFLAADRSRGFALDRPPLPRLALFRMSDSDWRMVFTFHHALLDGRGLAHLFQDVFGAYEAGLRGEPWNPPVPPPFQQYTEWLAALDQTPAEPYWRSTLRGFTAPTSLGVDRLVAAPLESPPRQAHRMRRLDAETTRQLSMAAIAHGVTLNTVFQGVWALLLSRYSGESDVIFGVTRACRRSGFPGADRLVAHLTNVLPLRVRMEPGTPFFPWLSRLRAQWDALRAVEHTPPARVLACSEVPGGLPLFDTALTFDDKHWTEALRTPSPLGQARRFEMYEVTNYPLALMAYGGDRALLKVEYDPRRLDQGAVDRLLGHLATLLEAAAGRPDTPAGALPLLPPAEQRLLLDEWNPPAQPAGMTRLTLTQRFEARAAATPDRGAVECGDRSVTYAELNAAANRVARGLRARGVGAETLVALCTDRSIELLVGLLGILKAGGAYVPIDLTTPAERVAFILTDSAAPVLLTQRHLLDRLPRGTHTSLAIEDLAATGETDNLAPAADADSLAYVIYTSGSTGQPKGVLVTHRNVSRLFTATDAWFRFGPDDVWTLFHSYAFDFSVWEIWGPLLYGGRLVVVPYEVSRSPEALVDLVAGAKVTVLNQTPSAFRQFSQADEALGTPPLSLRWVIFGGEALDLGSLRPWYDRRGDRSPRLVNMYGITETTVHVTYRPLSRADLSKGSVIGIPIPDLQVYILDELRRPVPIGVPGELYVGGEGVARGYLRRDDLTAERFVAHPFRPGERLYRTGDRARFLADRDIEYLGRLDFQVKIRGFRIELGEIEAALGAHPGVRESVVLCREDHPGEKRLVAYYVSRGTAGPPVAELRSHLQALLPDYMVPAAFVPLAALPVTENGKVDRRGLPIPPHRSDARGAEDSGSWSPREQVLAGIWEQVLRIPSIGRHDNYFELGGDSILTIQIATRAREAGLPLTVALLVKHPTIADLSEALERLQQKAAPAEDRATGDFPLTPIQRWFFELDPADRHHWNQSFLFAVPALEPELLAGAVSRMIECHDALRLRFRPESGEWRQRVATVERPPPFEVVDLRSVSDAELPAAIARATERAAASLDLSAGPLLRVVYLPLGGARGGRLLIAIHHLAVDGVSWRILREELEAGYQALASGAPIRPSGKTTSYRRWAETLAAYASAPGLQAQRSYWIAVSEGPLLALPVDRSRDALNIVRQAETLAVWLTESETTELLQRVPSVYNTQVNDALLTALSDALGPWVGPGSLQLDLEGHGREEVAADLDLTRTVGWFTSIFPVRLDLGRAGGIGTRLKAMKEQLRRIPGRGVGYGVLRYLAGDQELARRPPREIVFNYLGQFDQIVSGSPLFRFAPEDSGPWLGGAGRRPYLIEVNALVIEGRLALKWTYARGIHDEATIRGIAERMVEAIRALLRHCADASAGGRTPSDFALAALTQDEVDRVAGDGRSVEDILPLAPMQALFLATSGARHDVGFEQWQFQLGGPVDPHALRQAWQLVTNRHAMLRTGFAVAGVATPVQVVRRRVDLPFATHDWRSLGQGERDRRLAELLASDRALGFATDVPPLLRIHLIRCADEQWIMVWSHHHLLLDRWSWPIVLREAGLAYQAIREGRAPDLGDAPRWRSYIAELQTRDRKAAEAFWREELGGFKPSPLLPVPDATPARSERGLDLTASDTDALIRTARQKRVTINAMVAAAWALCVSRLARTNDIALGVTVAGRPEELPGIGSLVGMCINNLPIRLRFDRQETVGMLVRRFGERQNAIAPFEHCSLLDLQQWSGISWHTRLFDTLLVFQHEEADSGATRWLGPTIDVRMAPVETHTNYPLALVVSGTSRLSLRLAYQGRHADAAAADRMLGQLRGLLQGMPERYESPIGEMLDLLPEPETRRKDSPRVAGALPRTATEWVIGRIWAEMLGKEEVGVEESFFDLGGQSLVAMQIGARLRDTFRLDIPVSLLFEQPILAEFAAAVAARGAQPGDVERTAAIIRRVEEMSADQVLEALRHE